MTECEERPKRNRRKGKTPSTMHPKQVARLMREKYLQQAERCKEEGGETSYATDHVEEAGRWAADEAVSRGARPYRNRAKSREERPRASFKTRPSAAVRGSTPAMKVKPPLVRAEKTAARQTAQRQMTQRMVAQVRRAAKTAGTAAQRAAEAVVRATAALVSGLVGLLGGASWW